VNRQDQAVASLLRLTTIEYDAGMELRKVTAWAARIDNGGTMRTPGGLGSSSEPMSYLLVQDRDRPASEQEITQIPWRCIVSIVAQPLL